MWWVCLVGVSGGCVWWVCVVRLLPYESAAVRAPLSGAWLTCRTTAIEKTVQKGGFCVAGGAVTGVSTVPQIIPF